MCNKCATETLQFRFHKFIRSQNHKILYQFSWFSWFRQSIFLAKPTASSQSISQHRQYLGREPDVVGGGVTGAK